MQRKIGDKVKITWYSKIYYWIILTISFSRSETTEKYYYIWYDIFWKKNELSTPTQEELDLYFT